MKILFFAHDPGGVNSLIPLLAPMAKKWNTVVLGKDISIRLFSDSGIACKDIKFYADPESVFSLRDYLNNEHFDCIVTGTSANDSTEKLFWMAAKLANIKSIAVLDSWTNLGVRFSRYKVSQIKHFHDEISIFPDKICVIDDWSEKELLLLGIPRNNIVITGNPHFQYIRNRLKNVNSEKVADYRRRMVLNEDTKLIMYASDAISSTYNDTEDYCYWGFNEKTIFTDLCDALCEQKKQFALVVRPHPLEDIKYWNTIYHTNDYPFSIAVDGMTPLDVAINACDLIIGSYTMVLLEALLADALVMSVQIGLNREDCFFLSRSGIIETITDKKSLQNTLLSFFSGDYKQIILPDIYKKDSVAIIEEILRKVGSE